MADPKNGYYLEPGYAPDVPDPTGRWREPGLAEIVQKEIGGGILPLSISGPNGTANVGDTASFTPTISGGSAPYTVTATGLPPGRAINNASTGLTTGAYTTAGTYSATYTVTDSVGATASFVRSVVVSAATTARLAGLSLGQSLEDYLYSRGVYRVARFYAETLRTLAGYTAARNVAAYNSNMVFHDGASVNASDWTVRLTNCASGGSAMLSCTHGSLTAQNSHVDENGAAGRGNYWFNAPGTDQSAITGNAADNNTNGTTLTPGPLVRFMQTTVAAEIAAGRSVDFGDFSQGTSDMGTNAAYLTLYETAFGMLIDLFRSATGKTTPFFIKLLGTQYVSPDAGAEGVKQAQRNVVANKTAVYIAGQEYPYERAVTRNETVSVTSGGNTVTVADGTQWGTNQGVKSTLLASGTYISSISGNVLTLSRVVNGSIVASNFTATDGAATLRLIDNVHLYPGSDNVEPLDGPGGTLHDMTRGFYALCSTSARFIAQTLSLNGGAVTGAIGPFVSGASTTKGTNVVRATITHGAAGRDFTLKDQTGWRVLMDGAVVAVTGVAKVSSTAVDLTLASSIGGSAASVTVQYAYGSFQKSDPTQFIFDNASPVAYPMQARAAVSATIAESANALSASAPSGFSSATSATSFTQTAAPLGSVPSTGRRHALVGVILAAGSTTRSISSVTVAGKTAALVPGTTRQQNNSGATQSVVSGWYAVELLSTDPTSGDVVVTANASVLRAAITTRVVYGLPSASVTAFNSSFAGSATTTDPLTATINTATNGAAFGMVATQGGTEQRYGSASLLTPTAQTGLSVTATGAQGDITWTGLTETFDGSISTVTSNASILNLVSFAPV